MRVAAVITTYNRPDALAAVLQGYLAQSDQRFEVVVADDGSTAETARLIADYRSRATFPITHVWHQDLGFRAAAIRNRAVAATSADYLIFADGDCIPLCGFVAGHRRLAQRGCFVVGNRLLLSEGFTRRVLQTRLPVHTWPFWKWIPARMKNDVNRILPLLRIPIPPRLRITSSSRWQGAKTCNLAAWRDDLLKIDGFDESYAGWGLEDSDLVVRLIRWGTGRKSARFAVPVMHLWHQENPRDNLGENRNRLDEVIRSRATLATVGLHRHLEARPRDSLPAAGLS